ncbi:MAG: response regulator [Holophagaceae bacterium]|nr:response regulator [Holophagaceae bacterium]
MSDIQVVPERTTILSVDDQALVRLALSRILEKKGFRCLEAEDFDQAMERLDSNSVDLVLCDLHMPGRSGLDLVAALADRIPDLAIVMVSSADDTDLALECLEKGAYGYVLKPFKAREILIQVNGALRRRMLELDYRDRERVLAQKVREQTAEIRESRDEISFRLLAASEQRDTETGSHIRRIGLYAAAIARLLDWNEEAVDCIRAAAPMHDIGKIGVPDRILQKPGALTEQEWVLMKDHTVIGAKILQGSSVPFIRMGAQIAVCHHEKWDGSGYPEGLHSTQIPIEARITALVDVYDALSQRRCYKEAWPEEKVISFMAERRGTHLDPELIDLFLLHLDIFRGIRESHPDENQSVPGQEFPHPL